MKRQNSQLSSTSRRDNPPPDHSLRAKSIGCMSGILHLLSNYHNRRKIKSLTFGKSKPEKDIIVFSSPSDQTAAVDLNHKERKRTLTTEVVAVDFPRTRSPTLSVEIRRCSRSVKSTAETSIGKSPALVARLMGLEVVSPAVAPASSEIKRRKLLGALEKCDNDLKALKDIIMAFRSPETPISGDGEKKQQQQHLNRINRTVLRGRENNGRQEIIQQQLKKKKNPPAIFVQDQDTKISISSFNDPISKLQERIIKLQQINKNTTQFEITKPSSTITMTTEIEKKKKKNNNDKEENDDIDPPSTWRRSKAMAESLDEISNEISWGFKHEMAKIGLALQHHIYRELIDEMVTDMAFSSALFLPFDHSSSSSLPPFEACRRRLRF